MIELRWLVVGEKYAVVDSIGTIELMPDRVLQYRTIDTTSNDPTVNFTEWKVVPTETEDKRPGSDSERLAAYKTAIADAIRRPMGVVPHSASGLVSDEDLAAAEERRPRFMDVPRVIYGHDGDEDNANGGKRVDSE